MFTASCHCGRVVLQIARKPRKLTACNCSVCRRYGAIWAYFQRKSVDVVSARAPGADALQRYVWRNGTLEFYHCRTCGCVTHHERARKRADGTDTRAVNMRNVDDPAVVAELPIRLLDGASSWSILAEAPQANLFRSPAGAGQAPRRRS